MSRQFILTNALLFLLSAGISALCCLPDARAIAAGIGVIPEGELTLIVGGTPARWCREVDSCSESGYQCTAWNFRCDAGGFPCGTGRQFHYPEYCDSSSGNETCDSSTHLTYSLCQTWWNCICGFGDGKLSCIYDQGDINAVCTESILQDSAVCYSTYCDPSEDIASNSKKNNLLAVR